jgi:hypothetical protein
MHHVDGQDVLVPLSDVPQSSVGAPIPTVVAGEHAVALFYYGEAVGTNSESSVIVQFHSCFAHYFGPPNDEALSGHPLYGRGLRPYGSFEVQHSSWLRFLERMNSVHPQHDCDRFLAGRRHFALTFHDSIFECIAKGYIVEASEESISELVSRVGPRVLDASALSLLTIMIQVISQNHDPGSRGPFIS